MLFPQLSQEDIFKLLVPVDSTPPLPGRRAIALETFGSSGGHFEVTSNNYVILQPMLVKRTQVEQYDPYTIDYDEILPVNGFRLVR